MNLKQRPLFDTDLCHWQNVPTIYRAAERAGFTLKMLMRLIASIVLLAACAVSTLVGQAPYSALTLFVGPWGYLFPTYAAERRDPHAYLFFQEEPIAATVRILNQGDARTTLMPSSTVARRLFAIEATRDGRSFPIQVEFTDGMSRVFSGGEYLYSLDQSLEFEKGEGLKWHVNISNGALPAGLYELTFSVRGADEQSRPILPMAPMFVFEVRTPTDDDRPEVLSRQAFRQLQRREYNEANATVAELRRIHPRSVVAQMLREKIATAQGNRGEANAAIKQARTLLTTDQDELLRKFRTPEELREVLQGLPRER